MAEKESTPLSNLESITNTAVTSTPVVVTNDCQNMNVNQKILPTMVLTGTDVFEKKEFKIAPVLLGEYVAEMGGATIHVELKSQSENFMKVERTYNEPGLIADKKSYDNLCVDGSRIYGNAIVLEFVVDGVLFWEGNSGNEFISSDLFVYMKRMI